MKFESVNLYEALPFSKKYDIKSFPTMQYFKNGKAVSLEGKKSVANIFNFVLEQNEIRRTKIESEEEF